MSGHYKTLELNFKDTIQHYRESLKRDRDNGHEDGTDATRAIKNNLPAIIPAGIFSHRNNDSCTEYSGMVVLDIDGKSQNPKWTNEDAVNFIEKLERKKDKHIALAFISPSGDGVKIIARHDAPMEKHRDVYDILKQHYESKFGFKIDSAPDIARLCYLSQTAKVCFNNIAEPFQFAPALSLQPITEIKSNHQTLSANKTANKQTRASDSSDSVKLDALCDWITASGIDITDNYNEWQSIAFGLANSFGEDGRNAFHIISRNHAQYNVNESDAKYSDAIKTHRGQIEFASVIHLAQTSGFILPKPHEIASTLIDTEDQDEFWRIVVNEKKKTFRAIIDTSKLYRYLASHGINLYMLNGNEHPVLVRMHNNICTEINDKDLKTIVKHYINTLDVKQDIRDAIHNAVSSGNGERFGEKMWPLHFECISNPVFMRDTISTGYIYYQNEIAVIQSDSIKMIPYKDAPALVWQNWILQRDAKVMAREDYFQHDYYRFMEMVCTPNDSDILDGERFNALRWSLGYLCHNPQTTDSRMIIHFCEDNTEDASEGGTGKTIISRHSLQHIKKVDSIGNRSKQLFKSNFPYQNISPDTQIVHFGDVDKKYLVNGFAEDIFESVTDGMHIEKKNQKPVYISANNLPRMVSTGNAVPQTPDSSSRRRFFLMEIYSRFNDEIHPVHVFGRRFFEHEWNAKDWCCFDNAMFECIQYTIAHPERYEYSSKTLLQNQYKTNTHPEWESFILDYLAHPKSWPDEEDHEHIMRLQPNPDAQLVSAIGTKHLFDAFKEHCARLRVNHDNVTMQSVKRYMHLTQGMFSLLLPDYEWHYQFKKISALHGQNLHLIWRIGDGKHTE